jgi:hypothetical protein
MVRCSSLCDDEMLDGAMLLLLLLLRLLLFNTPYDVCEATSIRVFATNEFGDFDHSRCSFL